MFISDPQDAEALRCCSRLELPRTHVSVDLTPQQVRNAWPGHSGDAHSLRADVHRASGDNNTDEASLWPLPERNAVGVVVVRKSRARTVELARAAAQSSGGDVFVVGHKKRGGKSVAKWLKGHFESVEKLGSAAHCIAWKATGCSEGTSTKTCGFRLNDRFWNTPPGVFSAAELDPGTAMLIEALNVPRGASRALDFGAGCGVLTGALLDHGITDVVAVENDLPSVFAARENLANVAPSGFRVIWSDRLPEEQSFDLIVSNPPFHAASRVDTSVAGMLIKGAASGLNPGGELWLVANRFLKYPDLFDEAFGASCWERATQDGKFTVYRAWRQS